MSIEATGVSHDELGLFSTEFIDAQETIASSLEGPFDGSKLGIHKHTDENNDIDGYNIAIATQENISGLRVLVFDRSDLETPSKVIYLTRTEHTDPKNRYIGPMFSGFTTELKEGDIYKLSVTYGDGEYYNDNIIDDRARAFLMGKPDPDGKPNPYSVVRNSTGRLDSPEDFQGSPKNIIYEAHGKGSTKLQENIPEKYRGTYLAYTQPEVLDELVDLGVTAVEFLPLQFALPEPFIYRKQKPENEGGTNYWNYTPAGYFALNPKLAAEQNDPIKQQEEFKEATKALHARGIRVVVDVVYNHTAEADNHNDSPVYSKKALQNNRSYRHTADGKYDDYSGCGNTLDLNDPLILKEVIDSLRYMVTEYGIDGFRFDLGTALIRNKNGNPDPNHPLLTALREDEILKNCELLSIEPWDIKGVSEGYFNSTDNDEITLKEWNRTYRNRIKAFMNKHELGGGIGGFADILAGDGTLRTINYISSHDGFTIGDTVAYNEKHNWSNGEYNRDGTNENFSENHGHEGWDLSELSPEIQESILYERYRVMANMLAALAMTAGDIMFVAGDESGNSQNGNNNPYCHDNETTWIQRQGLSERNLKLKKFVQQLMAIRHISGIGYSSVNRGPIMFSETTEQTEEGPKSNPYGDFRKFTENTPTPKEDEFNKSPIEEKGIIWINQSGEPMRETDWHSNKIMGMYISGFAGEGLSDASVLLYYNHTDEDQIITLPTPETNIATAGKYSALASSYNQEADVNGLGSIPHGRISLKANSMAILKRNSTVIPEAKIAEYLSSPKVAKIHEALGGVSMKFISIDTPVSELDAPPQVPEPSYNHHNPGANARLQPAA